MKTNPAKWCAVPVLILALSWLTAGVAAAQTLTNLHNFAPFTSNDGSRPNGGMVLLSNVLYGTTVSGGSNYQGTVFRVNTDGTGYGVLYHFSNASIPGMGGGGGGGIIITGGGGEGRSVATNSDGTRPNGGLALSGTTLYGTAQGGGTGGYGTVFAINTDGTGFATLHNFTAPVNYPTNDDGIYPSAGVIQSAGVLYGTTRQGGSLGWGTVFKLNTDGSGFTTLATFDAIAFNPDTLAFGNTNGSEPETHLALSGGTLYGTTVQGGADDGGTVFAVNTDGTGFALLHEFNYGVDGSQPNALTLSGGLLYGSTANGGAGGGGTLFSLATNGTGFTTLYNFYYGSGGSIPDADLVVVSNIVFGATQNDGADYAGTLFSLYADGTGFTTLYTFTAPDPSMYTNIDGSSPAGLLLAGNVLYGTAAGAGTGGNGTVFSIGQLTVPAPVLNITGVDTNVVLSWSAAAAGFTLQSATNLFPPVAWSPVTPSPVVINGLNWVTNSGTGAAVFYRLSQ